jgi:aldose 1-epimerase
MSGPPSPEPVARGSTYGVLADGTVVERYTLESDDLAIGILTYGGIIDRIDVPDATGVRANVVLGYPDLAGYTRANKPYFGALIGRYANRIARGRFTLDGRVASLPINDPPNTLHGGTRGFDKAVWSVERATSHSVCLRHTSPDGDQGFPGELDVRVTYALDGTDGLRITYEASADAPTVVNLTNHSYFNLAGEAAGDILGHLLQLNASRYTPVGPDFIPTGELASVAGTPFDFRTPTAIGARIREGHAQLVIGRGYDHNWVLDRAPGPDLAHAAAAVDPTSGRRIDVSTTEPGVQFYSGNFLDASETGSGGAIYRQSAGFALETQHFPDAPNLPSFPATVLRPGQRFESVTVFRFSASDDFS